MRLGFSGGRSPSLGRSPSSGGISVLWALGEKVTENSLAHRPKAPGIDTNVDHPAPLTPALVDIAMQKPLTAIDGSMVAKAIFIMAVLNDTSDQDSRCGK